MLRARHAVNAAEEAQILLHREIAVERKFLRHVADALAHGFRIARDVDPGDDGAAAARAQQAAKDADDGRFAGAVRAEEAHDFAARDAETHMVHGDEGAEPLDEAVGDDLVAVSFGSARGIVTAIPLILAHPRFQAARRTRPRCWAQRPRSRKTARRRGRASSRNCGMRRSASSTTAWTPSPTRRTWLTPG